MHKHWSQITTFYIESNRLFEYKRLKAHGRKRDFVPTAVTLLTMTAISLTLHLFQNPVWPMVVLTGISLSMMVFFKSMDRLLAIFYPVEYDKYDIAKQRFLERTDFLAYALFMRRLKQNEYTPEKLKAITDYSETLSAPPKPFLINQHFITVILISILVSLCTAYLQKTSAWSTKGLVYILATGSLAIVVCLVLDAFRSSQTRDARIRRYLKRAQIEIEQEMTTKEIEAPPKKNNFVEPSSECRQILP